MRGTHDAYEISGMRQRRKAGKPARGTHDAIVRQRGVLEIQ